MEGVFVQDDDISTFTQHVSLCDGIFEICRDMPDIVLDPALIEYQRARLVEWASDMNVFGSISLDDKLRDKPAFMERIHQLLDVIYKALMSRKSLIVIIRLCELELQPNESSRDSEGNQRSTK